MEIILDREQKEIKNHGSYEFPLRISYEKLSNYEVGNFPLHWHPEIELTLILKGDIVYQVNDKVYHLSEGEGIFCNANALHAGSRDQSQDCEYLSVTFHPRLLYGYSSSIMQSKYVNPLISDKLLSSGCFKRDQEWSLEVLEGLWKIKEYHDGDSHTKEIHLLLELLKIWILLYEHVKHDTQTQRNSRDTERIRQIIQYIHNRYAEQITLEEIAGQIHLCRGESCRMFKRYMNETIFDYLTRYRIEKSLELLKDTSWNITQVAEKVGFASPGYYTRVFREKMGDTPLQYRKKMNAVLR